MKSYTKTYLLEADDGISGLSINAPLEDFKKKIEKEENWGEISRQLNILIFKAKKAKKIRGELSKWIETRRKKDPDFGKSTTTR